MGDLKGTETRFHEITHYMINLNINKYLFKFWPQHPAAHGVLKTCIELNGEISCKM